MRQRRHGSERGNSPGSALVTSVRVPAACAHCPGADIRHIQQLLGHASLETTALYTRVTPLDLQAAIARAHPREQNVARPRRRRR